MSISVIDKELINYFAQLNDVQKESMLSLMKSFLGTNQKATGETSILEYNAELALAMESIDRGELTTIEELENEMKSW
jgi:hypothetical protein